MFSLVRLCEGDCKSLSAVIGTFKFNIYAIYCDDGFVGTQPFECKVPGRVFISRFGTLTPLLRKMETKGFLTRTRSKEDERTVIISITDEGRELQQRVAHVPKAMAQVVNLTDEEFTTMYKLLYKLIAQLTGREQKV